MVPPNARRGADARQLLLNLPPLASGAAPARQTRLSVRFPDGRTIERPNGADTFAETLLLLGIDRVAALGLILDRVNVVTTAMPRHRQFRQSGAFYINTHASTARLASLLREAALHLCPGLKVEVIAKFRVKGLSG